MFMRSRLYAVAVMLFTVGLAPSVLAQLGDNECLIEVGDFRTQTQGGWGIDDCNGGNPACYRDAHFTAAFPDGVTLGGGCPSGPTLTFTTSESVAAFLPQGSTASSFYEAAVDPLEGGGVLAGQLLAAKLSLGFNLADPMFGAMQNVGPEDLLFNGGPYEDWTVGGVVAEADLALSGCLGADAPLSDLVAALTQFNEAYVDGTTTSDAFSLPGCDEVEPEETCSVQLNCVELVELACNADFSVEAIGVPAVTLQCCPEGAEAGSADCTETALDVDWTLDEQSFGECPLLIERLFTAAIAVNGVDTVLQCAQTVLITDFTAPQITCPPAVALDCGVSLDPENAGTATATDDCSAVIVTYADAPAQPAPDGGQSIVRVWTATDACGNSSSCEQTLTVPDAAPPQLSLDCPPDTTLFLNGDCANDTFLDLLPPATATALDDLDPNPQVDLMATDEVADACAGEITVTRTWTATATDACGNTAALTCQQTIVLLDDQAPEFATTCGISDGEVLTVCCLPNGTVDLPAPCIVTVEDNCGADVAYTEEAIGYAPVPGASQACAANQPEPFNEGLTCEGDIPHALRLFCFPGTDEQVAYFTAVGAGDIQYFGPSSWSLTWTVADVDHPNAGFDITATFDEGLEWADWIERDIPSGFKGECADLNQAQDWMYFLLTEGTLTGWGAYADSEFSLSHQPASTFYGTQVGLGANQHNAAYGFGSTLTYSGTFVEDGVMVAEGVTCCGDLHGEVECCLPFTLTRTYTATDCAGNASTFSYQIVSTGEPCPEAEADAAGQPEPPAEEEGMIHVHDMSPNPAGGDVALRFAVDADMEVEVFLLTLSGQVMESMGTVSAEPDVEETMQFQVGAFPAGLYQLQIVAPGEQATRTLLVVH